MAMIGIRCESDQLIEVAERLAEMPEVDYVVITAGTYDLLIETVCEDNEALLAFLAERLRAIDGVRETETFVYLRLVKQTYQCGHALERVRADARIARVTARTPARQPDGPARLRCLDAGAPGATPDA